MMTVSSLLLAAGGDMPLDTGEVLAMSVSELSTEELVGRVRALTTLQEATSLLRSKYLREVRDRDFPITGRVGKEGDDNTRAGWAEFLKQEFGDKVTIQVANSEIRGLESLEIAAKALGAADSDQFGGGPGRPQKTHQNNNKKQKELGKANGCGPKVAERILKGEISGKRQVIAAVKEAKDAAKLVGIKSVQPVAPKSAPKPMKLKSLPITGTPGGTTYSLAKWRQVPQVAEELEWMQAHVEKMRLAAVKYRNLCKQFEDRLAKGIANNRNRPAEMTVYALLWKEGGYDFDEALESVTGELSEAHRLWGISMPLCHGPAQVVE